MTSADEPGGEAVVVNHVGLCVRDLGVARRFYVDVLGFAVERELRVPDEAAGAFLSVEPPVNLTAVYLRRGAFVLELLHFNRSGNPERPPHPFNAPGLTHISLSVDDLGATLALVPGAGGEVVTRFPGAAIVRDPGGQLLELLPMEYHRQVTAN